MRKPQAAARQQLLLQRAADVLAQPSQAHGKRPVKGLHPTRGVRLATARLLECSCFALVLAACVLLTLNACCRVSDQPQWRGRYPCALQRSLDPSVSQRLGPVETCQGTDVFLDIYTARGSSLAPGPSRLLLLRAWVRAS